VPGTRTVQLGRLFGIRIGASPSWFVVLFLIIWVLSGQFRDALGDASETTAYVVAVVAAACFFLSLVAHELGHALVARRQGIGISGIDLWFFGGLAKMTRDTRSPLEELKVAGAGPLVTVVIAAACFGALQLLDASSDSALLGGTDVSPLAALLGWLTFINGVLFLFNMVPAFPLDGGRLARAAAWKVTGDRTRGTLFSARLGQGFAVLLMGLGVFLLVRGDGFDGLWFAVLGWFLLQAAGGAVVSTRFSERLDGMTAADVMVEDPDPRPIGVEHERDAWLAAAVPVDTPVEDLLSSEELRRLGSLPVVGADGQLRGIVTFERVRRVVTATVTT
jgi:Zn-dependent protease